MPDIIRLKRSGVAGAAPTSLELGEPALNYADGKLYYKNSAGSIVSFAGGGLVTAATPAAFPATGSATSLYVATDSQQAFRWDTTNSVYVEVGPVVGGGSSSSLTVTIPGLGDPYWSSVSLLLNCNGSNGSTTFTDSSDSAVTVTAVGNAQVSTSQKKFGTGSAAFDGSGDYLSVPTGQHVNFGTGDFAVELWFYLNAVGQYSGLFGYQANQSVTDPILRLSVFPSGIVDFSYRGGALNSVPALQSQSAVSANQWYHVAVARSSGVMRLYLNGQLQATDTPANPATLDAPFSLNIGAIPFDNTQYWPMNGYIDEVRITKGTRYTGASIAVPTAAFSRDLIIPCLPAT